MTLTNIRLPLKKFVKCVDHDRKVASARLLRRREGTFIKNVVPGDLQFDSQSFAIFVIYQPADIPWYVRNALDSLSRQKINVIAVLNYEASPVILDDLKQNCHTILMRSNQGFDIGGYRDATIHLDRTAHDIKSVIYMNDSVYYFQNGLDTLFAKLSNSSNPVVSAFENTRENDYHYQSFLFRVNGDVFRSQKFRSFWESYLPVSSRLYAIDEGEKGITRVLQEIHGQAEIIFTTTNLINALEAQTNKLILEYNNPAEELVNSLPSGLRFPAWGSPRPYLSRLERAVRTYSQVHSGGFLFRKFLDCPIIKRDLYYREFYTIEDLEYFFNNPRDETHFNNIKSDLLRKGKRADLSYLRKIKFDLGII